MKTKFYKLAKQIEKLENSDPDFVKNPKWQYLRTKQDMAYIELAKQQIEYHTSIIDKYKDEIGDRFKRECDKSREQIKFCEDFLKLFSKENNNIMYGKGKKDEQEKSEVLQNTQL